MHAISRIHPRLILSPRSLRTMASVVRPAQVLPHDPSAPRDDEATKLWSFVPSTQGAKKPPSAGTAYVFYGDQVTAVSSLGGEFAKNGADEKREAVRKAVAGGVKSIKDVIVSGAKDEKERKPVQVKVDVAGDAHAAAVGAYLSAYSFSLKTRPTPSPHDPRNETPIPERLVLSPKQEELKADWDRGKIYAEAQNLARTLQELPANMLTPTLFCERVKKEFNGIQNVEIIVRDTEWAKEKKMGSFLSVTKGTDEPAKFLEIHYRGAAQSSRPLAFVGKGITFDSGGISLKPWDNMKLMRGDMGGAGTAVSATLAIAKLKLPVNIVCVTPLTENMPGPSATKPGDVVYASNGLSVEIDDTDAEGRLVLADAMYYASSTFKPQTLVSVATLTGAMMVSLGEIYGGVFSTSDDLYNKLEKAGGREWDRFWRMPLAEEFDEQIADDATNADLMNYGGSPGGAVTAAMFLKPFAEGCEEIDGKEATMDWAHIDIAGIMESTRPGPYQYKGMTGRPVRALIEYVRSLNA